MRQRQRAALTAWLKVLAASTFLTAVPVGMEILNQHRLTLQQAANESMAAKTARHQRQIEQMKSQSREFTSRIAFVSTLQSKRPWAALLEGIALATPDEVWIQSVVSETQTFDPRATAGATTHHNSATSPEADLEHVIQLEGPSRLRLEGYAVQTETLYGFMAGLRAWNVFSHVRLARLTKEHVGQGEAIRFDLECGW